MPKGDKSRPGPKAWDESRKVKRKSVAMLEEEWLFLVAQADEDPRTFRSTSDYARSIIQEKMREKRNA